MVGTFLIAAIGYGAAIFFVLSAAINLVELAKAPAEARHRLAAAIACTLNFGIALAFAAVTRWLLGGAL
ncbi:hypothetical protein [Methylobacterium nodulans]|uniref:Uncharacterized protein n=1 Tax=Methylobacterium nodulans (strain LMG 21967 / CNCM I-2342 / ORS 2060) TaxID=460265 RepID=B8IIR8_METNO|nr:hypothetical protein [Methylobacterium nodulans]ACL58718.1 conserved hypothetical protein [Methylobacterium nodulans ORS 2060]ACL59945.1 conserved hypothetical protein [Methylobacterium nodulans ORS 2060]